MASEGMSRWISCIYRQGQIYVERELSEHGVSSGQHFILTLVCDNPGVSQEKLCRQLAMNKGTVARALKQLEANGFVQRDVNENNRRANMVYPTQKALDLQGVIDGVMQRWDEQITANMNGSEKLLLKSMLRRASENAVASVKPQLVRRRRSIFQIEQES